MNTQPVVEIDHLMVRYGEHTVLSDITTAVNPSEIRVVLGPSGCGKTTLMKTMIGLIRPHSGTVKVFSTPMGDPDEPAVEEVQKKIGVLFQNGALIGSLSVADNVALPLRMHSSLKRDIIEEIVAIKLGQVGLSHARNLFVRELSGGMRKRAALARALALDPPLLFCDEPSAGLDPVSSAGLDNLLLSLRERLGITIVVVTHELHSIERITDKLIFLHNGSILFEGTLEQARAVTIDAVADFFQRREPAESRTAARRRLFTVENTL